MAPLLAPMLVFAYSALVGKRLRVSLSTGRTFEGKLVKYDSITNIVLADAIEYMHSDTSPNQLDGKTRKLGAVIIIGRNISCVEEL